MNFVKTINVFNLITIIIILSSCGGSSTTTKSRVFLNSWNDYNYWNSNSYPVSVRTARVIDGKSMNQSNYIGQYSYTYCPSSPCEEVDDGFSTQNITLVNAAVEKDDQIGTSMNYYYDAYGNIEKIYTWPYGFLHAGNMNTHTDITTFSIANTDSSILLGFYKPWGSSDNGQFDISNKNWTLIANPTDNDLNWKYNTFSVWNLGWAGQGEYGTSTYGILTEGSSLPSSGSNTFTGVSGGIYIDSTKILHSVTSTFTANANYGTRTVGISSSGSSRQEFEKYKTFKTAVSDNTLNYSGNLTYSAGSNVLTGTLTTNSGMTGPSKAYFYGPNTDEFGGSFNLTGGGATYVGSYGAN